MSVPRRLGCITGAGLLSAALTLLLTLGIVLVTGGTWFSPGPLNAQTGATALGGVRSHAETGGRCEACHSAPWDPTTMSQRCLACHTAVNAELSDPTSLHGALMAQERATTCRGCHVEHRGPSASLTVLDPATFPHEAVGYSLTGHARRADGQPFACADCHTTQLANFDVAACTACHRQADAAYMERHLADFGEACLGCHDGVDRYSRQRFDHDRLLFPLTGKHEEIACAGCHAGARTVADLQAAPPTCIGCHRMDDAHQGEFGTDCAACHHTAGWKPATFDHSKSAFPLTGKHADVRCERCHVNQVFKGTATTCIGCHQDPVYHVGMFGTACADCHTADGWRPARYDRPHTFPFDHGESGVSPCKTCHPDRVNTYTCYGCHEHAPTGIESKHLEEGIRDFADCVKCHPTGQEKEGEGEKGEGEKDD
ncbi:MAG: hypothetical protein N2439_11690 [Anaerolineae bacterium]|nr:hypothetical protein [Anaerolineae bacterium]